MLVPPLQVRGLDQQNWVNPRIVNGVRYDLLVDTSTRGISLWEGFEALGSAGAARGRLGVWRRFLDR